ncbi:MAG: hypothetical protein WA982_00190 [Rubrobacteraceae bacterium]
MAETVSLGLLLLNQSQSLSGQIVMGTVCFTAFAMLYVLSFKWAHLWKGHIKVAAYLYLAVALGIVVFKLASLPSLSRYNLEPAAHMVEEIGCMGAYSYIGYYLSRKFINVTERPKLALALRRTFHVYVVCWTIAFALALCSVIGVLAPFPMTGLYVDLPGWSVLYRAVILVPGIFYCALFTFAFLERALIEETDTRLVARLTLLAGACLFWVFICVDELSWAAIQAYAPGELRNSLAGTHASVEGLLYFFNGVFLIAALVMPRRPDRTEKSVRNHKEFQRVSRQLKEELLGLYLIFPEWKRTRGQLHRAAELLELPPDDLPKIEKVIELVALMKLKETFTRERMLGLFEMRQALMADLPEASPERLDLIDDPLIGSLENALSLTKEPASETDLTGEPIQTELAAAIVTDRQVLGCGENYRLSAQVLAAYGAAKRL